MNVLRSLFLVLALGGVVAVATTGCSVAVTAKGSMFKRDSSEADRASLARGTAKALLNGGRTAEEVEQILRATGIDADLARRLVAEVQAELKK